MANSIIDQPLPLRDFSQKSISDYIIKLNDLNENHGQNANLQASSEGYDMYKSKFVNEVKFSEDTLNGTVEIQSKVRAKFKKIIYDVNLVIDILNNEILSASCGCPGGVTPSGCKHVFAVLSFLQEYCIKELYNAPTEILQKWHAPSKKKKIDQIPISEMFVRDGSMMQSNDASVNFSALNKLPKHAPIFSVLNDRRFNFINVIYAKSIPLPAVVLVEGLYINSHIPGNLSVEELFYFHENIHKSLNECYDIEMRTMNQNDEFWKKQRLFRLTSSKFHDICRARDQEKISVTMLNPTDISNIPAVRHGINNEKPAKNILCNMHPHLDFRDVGLVINPLFPYLGASPDGFFYGEESMLIEIKTIYNKDQLSLSELCEKSDFCLMNNGDGMYSLKETHKYYYQVQGQMAVCNIDNCLFSVFYDLKKEPFLQIIKFDKNFWQKIFQQLNEFYFSIHFKNIIKHLQ